MVIDRDQKPKVLTKIVENYSLGIKYYQKERSILMVCDFRQCIN